MSPKLELIADIALVASHPLEEWPHIESADVIVVDSRADLSSHIDELAAVDEALSERGTFPTPKFNPAAGVE